MSPAGLGQPVERVEEKSNKKDLAFVHIFLNHALEKDVMIAWKKIKSLDVVKGNVVFILVNQQRETKIPEKGHKIMQ